MNSVTTTLGVFVAASHCAIGVLMFIFPPIVEGSILGLAVFELLALIVMAVLTGLSMRPQGRHLDMHVKYFLCLSACVLFFLSFDGFIEEPVMRAADWIRAAAVIIQCCLFFPKTVMEDNMVNRIRSGFAMILMIHAAMSVPIELVYDHVHHKGLEHAYVVILLHLLKYLLLAYREECALMYHQLVGMHGQSTPADEAPPNSEKVNSPYLLVCAIVVWVLLWTPDIGLYLVEKLDKVYNPGWRYTFSLMFHSLILINGLVVCLIVLRRDREAGNSGWRYPIREIVFSFLNAVANVLLIGGYAQETSVHHDKVSGFRFAKSVIHTLIALIEFVLQRLVGSEILCFTRDRWLSAWVAKLCYNTFALFNCLSLAQTLISSSVWGYKYPDSVNQFTPFLTETFILTKVLYAEIFFRQKVFITDPGENEKTPLSPNYDDKFSVQNGDDDE